MEFTIRKAAEEDRNTFIDFTLALSRFNRSQHDNDCKYDDYDKVCDAIKAKAAETFDNRNEDTLILIAAVGQQPVGYAMARIYEESLFADNGSGRMGLFDELFVNESARGSGLGKKLLNEVMKWFGENRIRRVKLHAYSWNHGAKKLYERNGFKEYAVSYETYLE